MTQPRIVEIRRNVLDKNDRLAQQLRAEFARKGVLAVNLVSGPGAGKTELLQRTLRALQPDFRPAAVTGDLATANDAERLLRSGAPARQIVTGTVCHLEAQMVADALQGWMPLDLDFLFIENVGNLVCPGDFDLGEDLRVLVLSTTEGEDKPLKYPTLVHTADIVVINKLDLAQAVACDLDLLERNIQAVRPGARVLRLSARTGEGVEAWLDLLRQALAAKRAAG